MFITFEGIDFSGKSTQITRLEKRLRARGDDVLLVREPGGTMISEKIRTLLLDRSNDEMDSVTEFLLFSASRSQLVEQRIKPALHDGTHVIADRFHDSSTAYQGYGRGLDIESILHVHRLATHDLAPDLTFFIDIPVDESFRRRTLRAGDIDRMESADRMFFERIREGYLRITEDHPDRIVRVDGLQSIDAIANAIWTTISVRLATHDHQNKDTL